MGSEGLKGGLSSSQPILMLIAGFTAIAWYNVVELNVMIWFRFKRHRGLYFWSLLISSWGCALHAFAFLAKFFQIWTNDYVSVALICLGWYCMVTGQSLVLYSRLHLIMRDNKKVKWVLYMIITDAILFHVPTTVLVFGANSPKSNSYLHAYSIMEKIQVTAFALQESIISGLYVYYTWKIIRPGAIFQKANSKKVMRHLLIVNVLIIVMDLTLLGTEFANHYEIQTTYKSALYSIKLKLEFAILNQLVALTRSNANSLAAASSGANRVSTRGDRKNEFGRGGWFLTGPQGLEPPVRTYSVSASRSPISTRAKNELDDVVLRTVDVDVTISEPESSMQGNLTFVTYEELQFMEGEMPADFGSQLDADLERGVGLTHLPQVPQTDENPNLDKAMSDSSKSSKALISDDE